MKQAYVNVNYVSTPFLRLDAGIVMCLSSAVEAHEMIRSGRYVKTMDANKSEWGAVEILLIDGDTAKATGSRVTIRVRPWKYC